MSLGDALVWKRQNEQGKTTPPLDQEVLAILGNRDHVSRNAPFLDVVNTE